jgi:Tfp pilus assembly protein PilV
MVKKKKSHGYTYLEIMIALFLFLSVLGLFIKTNGYLQQIKYKAETKEKMLYVAQSILEQYKHDGLQEAQKYQTTYTFTIKEVNESINLKKVIITVNEKNGLHIELANDVLTSIIKRV